MLDDFTVNLDSQLLVLAELTAAQVDELPILMRASSILDVTAAILLRRLVTRTSDGRSLAILSTGRKRLVGDRLYPE